MHAGLIADTPVAATLAALHEEHKSRQQAVAATERASLVQVVRPDVQAAVKARTNAAVPLVPLLLSSGQHEASKSSRADDAFARLAGVDADSEPGQPMRMDWAAAYAAGPEDTAADGGNVYDVLAQRGREESSYGYGTAG